MAARVAATCISKYAGQPQLPAFVRVRCRRSLPGRRGRHCDAAPISSVGGKGAVEVGSRSRGAPSHQLSQVAVIKPSGQQPLGPVLLNFTDDPSTVLLVPLLTGPKWGQTAPLEFSRPSKVSYARFTRWLFCGLPAHTLYLWRMTKIRIECIHW